MKSLLLVFPILFLDACGTAEHSVRVADEQAFGYDTKIIVGEVVNKTARAMRSSVGSGQVMVLLF